MASYLNIWLCPTLYTEDWLEYRTLLNDGRADEFGQMLPKYCKDDEPVFAVRLSVGDLFSSDVIFLFLDEEEAVRFFQGQSLSRSTDGADGMLFAEECIYESTFDRSLHMDGKCVREMQRIPIE